MPGEGDHALTLHVRTLGDRGSPVVLVHGLLLGSLATWSQAVAPALAARHRVVLYDLRGHGASRASAHGYGVRDQAADLARVVDEHAGDAPVTLVGHSVGGAIALRAALDRPGRVARIVLVDTPLPVMASEWIARVRGASPLELLKLLPATGARAGARDGPRGLDVVKQVVALTSRTSLLADLLAEPDIADAELAALVPPLLLCYATRDGPVLQATRERLLRLVPDVRLTMLEGGHALPLEAPGPLAAAVEGFIDG